MKICLEQLLFNPLLYKQGGEFDLSIFGSFRSLTMIDRDQITLVNLLKKFDSDRMALINLCK